MKKFLVLFALAAFFIQAKAQTIEAKQVPVVVVTSFNNAYPAVENPVWRKSGTYYVVDYNQNNNAMYVMYDASGKLIESGEGVVAADYPASLTSYVKTKYKDEKIVKVYKIKDANGKTVWKGKVKQDYLYFDENGNYIKMEKD
jgi:hypothetical protein